MALEVKRTVLLGLQLRVIGCNHSSPSKHHSLLVAAIVHNDNIVDVVSVHVADHRLRVLPPQICQLRPQACAQFRRVGDHRAQNPLLARPRRRGIAQRAVRRGGRRCRGQAREEESNTHRLTHRQPEEQASRGERKVGVRVSGSGLHQRRYTLVQSYEQRKTRTTIFVKVQSAMNLRNWFEAIRVFCAS